MEVEPESKLCFFLFVEPEGALPPLPPSSRILVLGTGRLCIGDGADVILRDDKDDSGPLNLKTPNPPQARGMPAGAQAVVSKERGMAMPSRHSVLIVGPHHLSNV